MLLLPSTATSKGKPLRSDPVPPWTMVIPTSLVAMTPLVSRSHRRIPVPLLMASAIHTCKLVPFDVMKGPLRLTESLGQLSSRRTSFNELDERSWSKLNTTPCCVKSSTYTRSSGPTSIFHGLFPSPAQDQPPVLNNPSAAGLPSAFALCSPTASRISDAAFVPAVALLTNTRS